MYNFTYDSLDSSVWTIITETQGSDYSGSSVTRANYEWFRDNHGSCQDLAMVSGWFFGYGIAYRTAAYDTETLDETIRESIDTLSDYPLICDETLYRVESRWINDVIDDFIHDFKRAVEKSTGNDELWNDIERIDVRLIFDACMVESSTDWIMEHSSAWIDVDRLAFAFDRVIRNTDLHLVFKA